ncbi:MAG: DUF1178 family protein [Deltaproteobacteria bacterium]|jgi:hypothetical protein|nr:DUF1178 family protein [Deltaproteobacteria bacterium]
MVIFDLICLDGHQFEGWFDDLTDLESKLADGQLTCPICGAPQVSRRPSTFGLVKSRSNSVKAVRPASQGEAETTLAHEGWDSEKEKLDKMVLSGLMALTKLAESIQKDCVDVGSNFAAEALKMRYGVIPNRNIRGHSTEGEEKILRSEGVDFFKLPILSRKDTDS